MAARLSKTVDERTRLKIQTTQLVKRLTSHALGEQEMTSTQIRAIEILLKKSLPDLQNIEISGDQNNPLNMKWTVEVTDSKPNHSAEIRAIKDHS